MSKRCWYGRPNKPPENWHTPDKPAVRNVTELDDMLDEDAPSAFPMPGEGSGVVVSLTKAHWTTLLKLLHCYGQDYGDTEWQVWRLGIRRAVLDRVDRHWDSRKPVAVRLPVKDWRLIWQQVGIASQVRGTKTQRWFSWLSQTMTEQITAAGKGHHSRTE